MCPDTLFVCSPHGENSGDGLFGRIADDLQDKGYSINPAVLPASLSDALLAHMLQMQDEQFNPAGIGREPRHMHNRFVRNDEICWITGESTAGRNWLRWAAELQTFLNRRLLLGLFSFESHFARYAPGAYYKRHLDAFRGDTNRVLSIVAYLNTDWAAADGGELVLYSDMTDRDGLRVSPIAGTVVIFLSEEFPHEVLPARRDRYSIAGWYSINRTTAERPDPPR
ncbi:MAG: 2OG-Fe(II) oxygenase [Gammaproteobacteria bacterium]|jgi:SM-20-related protein